MNLTRVPVVTDLDVLLGDLERLVRCESPTEDLPALARSAELVAAIGRTRLGVTPDLLNAGGRPHLRWRFGSGPAVVLLLAHHDTVWPMGSLATHPWSVVDGVVTGPGCFDMKAGLVMAIQALALLPDLDGVTLLVTGDEEIGSPSSRELIEAEAKGCTAALVLEASGPGGMLKTGRKGVSRYDVEITGLAAHAGLEPEKGINAGLELAHQILAISDLVRSRGLAAGTSVTPTAGRIGSAANTVPAGAFVAVDCRMWTADEQVRVDEAMHGLAPVLAGTTVRVDGGPNRPPMESSTAQPLFALAREVAASLGLPAPQEMSVGGGSDGNFTAGMGIPTLDGLGAVGGGAHADDEHVVVSELLVRVSLLAGIISRILEISRG